MARQYLSGDELGVHPAISVGQQVVACFARPRVVSSLDHSAGAKAADIIGVRLDYPTTGQAVLAALIQSFRGLRKQARKAVFHKSRQTDAWMLQKEQGGRRRLQRPRPELSEHR